eukprot:GFKZ01003431.1.p1 GENE.GFKZ01003431.1~~GFKZ01003431.1.p1  ORF type:complete len:359 (+),score=55.92 GFKZ01003431.1:772-1848(+)
MKAMILVGGYGTRLRPLTLSCPKPLVDFCNKPMIMHQIEALAAVGVTEVVLAVNYQPEKMTAFLKEKQQELGIKITTSQETEPMGTAGPIKLAEQYLNDGEPFFVLNSDVACEYPFEDMIAYQKDTGAAGVLLATPVDDPSKFGVILYDDQGKIESFIEKPKQFVSRFINAGIYYLSPEIFNRIELRPTSMEKEVFPAMADEGLLYVMELKGFWADVGQPKDYLTGQTMRLDAYSRDEPDRLAKGKNIIGNVLIDPEAQVHSNAVLGPDVVVGPGCVVGDGARIKGTTLLKGSKIGGHTYVSKSIIGWHSKIGSWVRIENNSVLGEDVTVGDEFHVNESIVLPHKGVKKNLTTATIIL